MNAQVSQTGLVYQLYPTPFEQGVWKRHYVETVLELHIGKPKMSDWGPGQCLKQPLRNRHSSCVCVCVCSDSLKAAVHHPRGDVHNRCDLRPIRKYPQRGAFCTPGPVRDGRWQHHKGVPALGAAPLEGYRHTPH